MDNEEQMTLDNIDESVNDEGKIVSCKWLSLSLSLNINKAIRLLEDYNDKFGKELDVLYFVGGRKKGENHLTLTYKLAKQDSLAKVKSTFDEVTTCHIYCVQKTCIKDVGVLYSNHLDITNEYLSQINQGSAIQCDLVKDLPDTLAQRTLQDSTNDISNGFHDDINSEEEKTKHQPTANDHKPQNSSKTSKNPSTKETTQKPFFVKGTSKNKNVESLTVDLLQEGAKDIMADKSNEVKQLNSKGKGEKNDISAAFAKTKKTPGPPKKKVEDKKIEIGNSSDEALLKHSNEEKENHSEDEKHATKQNEKENHLVSTVKDDINKEKSKKRKARVVDSESDDDDDFEKFLTKSKDPTYTSPEKKKSQEKTTVSKDDDNDVIEPTPEPIKKKKRRRIEKDESTTKKEKDKNMDGEKIEKKEKTDVPKVVEEKNSTDGKRRGRRMVMKSKQYLDKDGFMVTRKECESESFSEESDSEMTEEKLNTLSPEKKKAVEKKKVVIDLEKKTKAHLSKPKTQALLMNFFKKK